ncbi:methyltransferase family protein [Campylobacter geochelonis]|uniref:Isoprenylcysteine carboxylmethyltransferase family protein n=1 Tax=Campylobacter geochelonis TaxID=1780362 RepID=A0A128EJE8_9BACT|nr:methyltransferase [Campylobacter geochelonis]QKF71282.1 isoprenylcysteine carboxylmethyltransferase family protein [Campylobacter geochelonis]CZE49010.1 Putative protein-S-isoprenylcysteine methyltransferase [Campylobacter geochelonis]
MKEKIKKAIGMTFGIILPFILFPAYIYFYCKDYHAFILENDFLSGLIGFVLIIFGLIFIILADIAMQIYVNQNPLNSLNLLANKTKILVTNGIYRYFHHPLSIGYFLFYFGFSFALNSKIASLISFGTFIFMIYYAKKYEEKELLSDFGDEYLTYKKEKFWIRYF